MARLALPAHPAIALTSVRRCDPSEQLIAHSWRIYNTKHGCHAEEQKMKHTPLSNLTKLSAFALVLFAAGINSGAHAQWDPEAGDTGEWAPPPAEETDGTSTTPAEEAPAEEEAPPQNTGWEQAPAEQPQQQQQPAWMNSGERPPGFGPAPQPEQTETPETPSRPSGETDHSQVSFGIGFFGVESFSLVPELASENFDISLTMPMIGARYWLTPMIGLDVAVGVGVVTRKDVNTCITIETGSDGTLGTVEDRACESSTRVGGINGGFGIGLHVGLPIALKTFDHFNILVTPEVGFRYGQATAFMSPTSSNLDVDFSSIALDVGVQLGGELQFGFWGVPNLAIQVNLGLALRYSTRTAKDTGANQLGVEQSGIELRTLPDTLGGSFRLLYYF